VLKKQLKIDHRENFGVKVIHQRYNVSNS